MNTLLFAMIDPALAWIRKHSAFARRLEARDDPLAALPMSTPQTHLTGQVVIVGYGKVGTRIAHALDERGIAYVVVEQNRELVEKLRADGVAAVSGDAIEPVVLVQAHIARGDAGRHAARRVRRAADRRDFAHAESGARGRVVHEQQRRGRPAVERGRRHGVHERERTRARDDRTRARQNGQACGGCALRGVAWGGVCLAARGSPFVVRSS
jgi:2-polyprenyl-6-methoxyphenol hydroxylase-like FAD-dependent oxidoreductase